MNIEELVNRAYTRWPLEKNTSWTDHMRAALTEQAATHAIELRAYEATVANLEQRIRQLEAQRVPEKVECGCGDIYPASQFMCANCLAAVGAADELRRVDEAQSVPVVGEPDCYDAGLLGYFGGGNVEWWQDYIRSELERAHEFYVSQWPSSIPAAELATLREKAAMVDELQKRAERMQKALSDIAEWTDRYTTPGHPVSTIARAAIAQGKGE